MQQLALTLEPGLAVRYRDMRECFAACVYGVGLGRVAVAIDVQPSNLSAMLSGERHLDPDMVERYMVAFNDSTPARFWAAKYLQDPEMLKAHALAAIPGALEQFASLLAVAGYDLPKPKRGRG
jgi:plasmid maintenance system antidote protein VapI